MSQVIGRWTAFLLVLLIVLLFLHESLGPQNRQLDDAYITYRYAQNFANGQGLVYNPGERVEGYTNLSWVLLVALGIQAGFDAEHVGLGLALLTSALLLIATYRYTFILLGGKNAWLAVVAPLILFSSSSFVMWSSSGLETPLFALCCVCGFIATHRQRSYWVLFWCALAVLTRPDGVLLAAILIGVPLLQKLASKGVSALRWTHVRNTILFASVIAVLTAWRFMYYGDYVPNTFHAKVGSNSLMMGLNYAWLFLLDGNIFLLPPFILAAIYTKRLWLEVSFLILLFAYCTKIGGDAFPLSRFYLPLVPLLAGGAVLGASALPINRVLSMGAAVSVVLGMLWYWYGPPLSAASILGPRKDMLEFNKITFPQSAKRDIAKAPNTFHIVLQQVAFLEQNLHEDDLVATQGIGMVGYQLKNPILDLLGLTDRTIAHSNETHSNVTLVPGHQRADTQYVLSRSPAAILIPKKDQSWIVLPATRGLWDSEEFSQRYYYNESLGGYLRRDILPSHKTAREN